MAGITIQSRILDLDRLPEPFRRAPGVCLDLEGLDLTGADYSRLARIIHEPHGI